MEEEEEEAEAEAEVERAAARGKRNVAGQVGAHFTTQFTCFTST
jgi:hypothetical protein